VQEDDSRTLAELRRAAALRDSGQPREAAAIYSEILGREPDHYEANYSLGMMCHRGGRNDLAIPLIKKSIEVRPDIFAGVLNLGMIQREAELLEDARDSFEAAVALEPGNALAQVNLGLVLMDMGALDLALVALERALDIEPDDAMTLARLGMLHQVRNEPDLAADCFRRALVLRPDNIDFHRSLALVQKQSSYNDNLRWMEQALAAPDCPTEGRLLLNFALGKSFDDLGDHDRAFGFWREGHRVRAGSAAVSLDRETALFDLIRRAFDESFLAHCASHTVKDETPVFVLGMPRSGTSLTEQILASHPAVHGAGEVEYLRVFAQLVEPLTGKPFPEDIATVPADRLRDAGLAYITKLRRNAGDALRVVDKLPHNFLRIGLIAAVMPRARIILCERDPLDNCLSIYQNLFSATHPWTADLATLGRYYRLYQGLMEHWDQLLPGHLHRVRYETLIGDTENQVRALLAHCGLPFHQDCLDFHRTRRQVKTPSEAQVRQPIYRDSLQRWKNYECHLGPLIEALGEGEVQSIG
jgi:tetratricopeptide (TPR) repeat protein